jgi:hypothetical protein
MGFCRTSSGPRVHNTSQRVVRFHGWRHTAARRTTTRARCSHGTARGMTLASRAGDQHRARSRKSPARGAASRAEPRSRPRRAEPRRRHHPHVRDGRRRRPEVLGSRGEDPWTLVAAAGVCSLWVLQTRRSFWPRSGPEFVETPVFSDSYRPRRNDRLPNRSKSEGMRGGAVKND